MRRARITFNGAFHHIMNRGLNGCDIFFDTKSKLFFLHLIHGHIIKYKIKLYAFCIMKNHYHLIIQNSSGKMSEFMKQLNGDYGQYYRMRVGGKGYVFQNRYKSTLIQEDKYLKMSIIYTLLNPVRKRIISNPFEYKWSSINLYFKLDKEKNSFITNEFVERLFGNRQQLIHWLDHWKYYKIAVKNTRVGEVVADDDYLETALKKYDRRTQLQSNRKGTVNMRINDPTFTPVETVIRNFEKINKVCIRELKNNNESKKLIGFLLAELKENAGLTYREINKLPVFNCYKCSSLGKIYTRIKNQCQNVKHRPQNGRGRRDSNSRPPA